MIEQDVNDLLWIRREFWSTPTGLVGTSGLGPVVVAGHTPSISMPRFASLMCGSGVDEDLRGVMVEVGCSRDTGIRREFWSTPTGLVGTSGLGPVVVAGHTPSISMPRFASLMCGSGVDEDLRVVMVEVGCSRDTGGVADRVCIDCSAAAGLPSGRGGMMRLEERRGWRAVVVEGE